MATRDERQVGLVATVGRYPVKSMRGEACEVVLLTERGVIGDRTWAVLDLATGKVASAKRPKLWRGLLACAAQTIADGRGVEVVLPDGSRRCVGDPSLDRTLSALVGRQIQLSAVPPDVAEVDRTHPEALLMAGLDAEVASDILKLGAAAPPGTFFDYAPLHLVTTATLDGLSAALSDGPLEPARYRPNIVIRTPDNSKPFPENDWVGATLRIGDQVMLRVVLQTPRCAIPTLAQGEMPPRPGALVAAVERNRVDIEGFGNQPCAGVYATILRGGAVRRGDQAILI